QRPGFEPHQPAFWPLASKHRGSFRLFRASFSERVRNFLVNELLQCPDSEVHPPVVRSSRSCGGLGNSSALRCVLGFPPPMRRSAPRGGACQAPLRNRLGVFLAAIAFGSLQTGCSANGTGAPHVDAGEPPHVDAVVVSPDVVTLNPGGELKFSAVVQGSPGI